MAHVKLVDSESASWSYALADFGVVGTAELLPMAQITPQLGALFLSETPALIPIASAGVDAALTQSTLAKPLRSRIAQTRS